jgi:hypothetical protein
LILLNRLNVRAALQSGDGIFGEGHAGILLAFIWVERRKINSREALEDGVFMADLSSLISGMLLGSTRALEACFEIHNSEPTP